jgi:hypothetical protein
MDRRRLRHHQENQRYWTFIQFTATPSELVAQSEAAIKEDHSAGTRRKSCAQILHAGRVLKASLHIVSTSEHVSDAFGTDTCSLTERFSDQQVISTCLWRSTPATVHRSGHMADPRHAAVNSVGQRAEATPVAVRVLLTWWK